MGWLWYLLDQEDTSGSVSALGGDSKLLSQNAMPTNICRIRVVCI